MRSEKIRRFACQAWVAVGLFAFGPAQAASDDVTLENARFRLTVGGDALVKSLVLKSTGEELADAQAIEPLFTVTQERPFNNEVKLIHPNKRTTYFANRLRREGSRLVVGFEQIGYEAVVSVKATDAYLAFALDGFRGDKEVYKDLKMETPPAVSFRVVQVPVRNRANFGDWLNASWDEQAAVGVMATESTTDADHERRRGYRLLFGDLVANRKLRGGSAALVVAAGREDFLDCVDALERDYNLPRGVAARRSPHVNASIYHGGGVMSPTNIDEHIAWARRGGFKYMTFPHQCVVFEDERGSWSTCGDYDWNTNHYPNGAADVKAVLAKIKAAGIRPGLHVLAPHIGLRTRYATPVADPRLNKRIRFTLASPVPAEGNVGEIAVLESTAGCPLAHAGARILQFGGELFSYTAYTTERPYRFTGVRRGAWATRAAAHPTAEVGGLLDMSEYGPPDSCYIDQSTDLQDEIAAKIARIWDCGFEYMYFDGAEGVSAPYNFQVSDAIWRCYKVLDPEPLFSEGAAKTHFGWHMLSGANAFDCFRPEDFKANIVRYPLSQAPLTWQDMTRVNFGWWGFYLPGQKLGRLGETKYGTQPDQWEFSEAKSIAVDCPATIIANLAQITKHPRSADIFEAMRRWETIRASGRLTAAEKRELADPKLEHHAYLRPDGEIEIVRITPVKTSDEAVKAYSFTSRDGRKRLLYWHQTGSGAGTAEVDGQTLMLVAAGWRYIDL